MDPKFTTCITNFSRIDHLDRCIKSLKLSCDKQYVSLATYGATPEHEKYKKLVQSSYQTEEDHGCNRLWMQAIAMARTRWVSILHDDDIRPDGFSKIADELCTIAEKNYAGFIAWNGLQYFVDTNRTGGVIPIAAGKGGVIPIAAGKGGIYDSISLVNMLQQKDSLPNSPVSFMFDRNTCLDVLSWCEDNLSDCVTRPKMMVGNDVALVAGHVQRNRLFVQSSKNLSLYGHWDGSETVAWSKGNNSNLVDCYNRTRERLFKNTVFPVRRHKLFIHVTISGPTTGRRQDLAWKTWNTAFKKINPDYIVVPVHLNVEDLPRNSSFLGDTRKLGMIRDLLQFGRNMGNQGDIVVLSNDDVCVTEDAFVKIINQVEKHGATFCHRRDFFEQFNSVKTQSDVNSGRWHAGIDLVAMTGKWWDEVCSPNFPDFVIGCEAWDWVMRWLITYTTKQYGFKNLIYHEYHGGWWEQPANRFTNKSQIHNRTLAKWWMSTHGSYNGEFDGTTMPIDLNVEPDGCDE